MQQSGLPEILLLLLPLLLANMTSGFFMAHRPNPQYRLRLLVHQAFPGGSPSSTSSNTMQQSGLGTPAASPLKRAAPTAQQEQLEEKAGGGGSNPQWWLLVRCCCGTGVGPSRQCGWWCRRQTSVVCRTQCAAAVNISSATPL